MKGLAEEDEGALATLANGVVHGPKFRKTRQLENENNYSK